VKNSTYVPVEFWWSKDQSLALVYFCIV